MATTTDPGPTLVLSATSVWLEQESVGAIWCAKLCCVQRALKLPAVEDPVDAVVLIFAELSRTLFAKVKMPSRVQKNRTGLLTSFFG